MILGFPPKALRLPQLMAIVTPEETKQPEVIPHSLFSTRLYPAGGATRQTFFDGTAAIPMRDNINNGALPAPQFFVLHRLSVDILALPSSTLGAGAAAATPVAGAFNDIELLTKVGNGGLFKLEISNKNYIAIPIRHLPAAGGATGFLQLTSGNIAATQPGLIQVGNNGIPGLAGWAINGMIAIPPQTNFLGSIDWNVATAISVDTEISVTIYGALYRKVL